MKDGRCGSRKEGSKKERCSNKVNKEERRKRGGKPNVSAE